ncbi:hypothetical protein SOV_29320 [Sporomusa ovata DSM 2662]|uniref:DUF4157 domain-containing protein n=1 Tax=Sporomusa ovata TaxID=2378 RepID=A0A0U1KRQ4_9FIRM|nr:peptidase MA [Sporomusa ovata]EQB24901.1 peptidase MA superfamily [Sporomusa ovata DSM 2662]CQR70098.1 hypothetical protein SpAn4DRAFT_4610 [Sporomusa ovata]
MRMGMRQIRLLISCIILVTCFAVQAQNALAATIHIIPVKGVSKDLANEFGSITSRVLQFYQEVYNFTPAKSIGIVIVANEQDYVQRLQLDGYSKEQAIRTAKVSSGIFLNSNPFVTANDGATYTFSFGKIQYSNPTIIICADKSTTYIPRICTLTHEMFHLMQQELKGNNPAHEWLVEGSARAAEFVLLEWLGKGSLASHRHNLSNSLVNVKCMADPNDMKNGGFTWIKLIEENMYPYQVSEAMTDYLLRKVGKPSVIRYFALISETGDRNVAFRQAFGMSYNQFVKDYKAYMKQEAAAAGRIKFDVEGEVAPEVVRTISGNGVAIEQMLRSQGWTMTMSQRFVLVPNADVMQNVLRRELYQINEGRWADIARRATIAVIGEMNYVYDTGKTVTSNSDINPLALVVCRDSILMTAQPSLATSIYWLYEGTAQLLAAKATEAAGGKSVANCHQEWISTIRKAAGYPSLTQMKSLLPTVTSRYKGDVIYATVALAAEYLAGKTDSGALLRYFTVLRDHNDGPQAFQQVFGMSVEAFDADFAAYLNAQQKESN